MIFVAFKFQRFDMLCVYLMTGSHAAQRSLLSSFRNFNFLSKCCKKTPVHEIRTHANSLMFPFDLNLNS